MVARKAWKHAGATGLCLSRASDEVGDCVTADAGSIHAEEKVRTLQRKLYRVAKAQPQPTFGVLFDKVYSEEVLRVGWDRVRRNRGAAGVDGQTIEAIEGIGVEPFLQEIREELRSGKYRPEPVRRVFIPKSDGKQRPLGIPRVKDRVVQAAVRIVIEPLFEASFRPRSFGGSLDWSFYTDRVRDEFSDSPRFALSGPTGDMRKNLEGQWTAESIQCMYPRGDVQVQRVLDYVMNEVPPL